MPWLGNASLLVVERTVPGREGVLERLRAQGWTCVATSSYDEAVFLAGRHCTPYAVLEYLGTAAEMALAIRRLRQGAPSMRLIGTSADDRRQDFADAGVSDYLPQPCSFQQMQQMLRDQIGPCADCGLDLPLRRPVAREQGQTWVCRRCGARYLAMLDEQASEKDRLNVRPD